MKREKEKITVKFVNINGVGWEDLQGLKHITDEDYVKADAYNDEEDKVARLISAYLKRKYIGVWKLGANGKPVAAGKYFNLSHTRGAVVFAESDCDVGIDIEKIRPVNDKLKRHIASGEEYAHIKDEKTFFEIWTAKESLAKAAGSSVAMRANTIPALPLDGEKRFSGEKFFSRCLQYGDYVISITRKGGRFEVEIQDENFIY